MSYRNSRVFTLCNSDRGTMQRGGLIALAICYENSNERWAFILLGRTLSLHNELILNYL